MRQCCCSAIPCVACNGCAWDPSTLTFSLNRVAFGLTFEYILQGASWPAKVYTNLLPRISRR